MKSVSYETLTLSVPPQVRIKRNSAHVHKKHMMVMSLLIDLRIKSVTHRWAITGKNIYLQPVKRILSKSIFSLQGVLYSIGFCLGTLK